MREICLVEISTNGAYSAVYVELIGALSTALSQLGVQVHFELDRIRHDMPCLVFAWYRQFIDEQRPLQKLPSNCVIVNLAPLSGVEKAPWLERYIKCLKDTPVLDYSHNNVEILTRIGNTQNSLFKFGYLPLSAFQFPSKNLHYVFYGKVNEHRIPTLKYLREELKMPLRILHNCWGHERDLRIATAKATINIGKFDASVLEVYRIWHSLCLGTPVISERGGDEKLVQDWQQYVQFVESKNDWMKIEVDHTAPGRYAAQTSFLTETECLLAWLDQLKLCR
ncbi:hypothetical protein [Undibacterium flavidum]|uniref:Glycosyl transferase family 1 n=1 Tax=Undibacterium flavidum TaxID=2762297 RepID=A0ABR6YB55_9BURK|nr:hypothetical protein [Undibacterium flavidum]MBC3873867.1 hypothetical protein [Undibacterium flavidum]